MIHTAGNDKRQPRKHKTEFVPTEAYETQTLEGWTVHVNRALLGDKAELGTNALKLLEVKLNDIVQKRISDLSTVLRSNPRYVLIDLNTEML